MHKPRCQEHIESIKTCISKLHGKFPFYTARPKPNWVPCYFGNSLANDLLRLKGNEWKKGAGPDDPSLRKDYYVLSVGCENLRNLLETTASLPVEYKGRLHMTLNDLDPFVQARNVLHLYMMYYYAEQDKIENTIATICYSLHLASSQYNLLKTCLRALMTMSDMALMKITDGVLTVSNADMDVMKEVWEGWLNLECRRGKSGSIDLRKNRNKAFQDDPMAPMGIDLYRRQIPEEYLPSVDHWLLHGIFMPDCMPDEGKVKLDYDNPTLTGYRVETGDKYRLTPKEYGDFVYCVPVDMYPFGTWDYLKAKGFKPDCDNLIDVYHAFISSRFKSTLTALRAKRLSVHINIGDGLHARDDIAFMLTGHCFDRIFTANVADEIGSLTLVKGLKDLLNRDNKCAVLMTQYWNWYSWFPNAIVDNMKHVMDGTYERCLKAATKDTTQHVPVSRFWIQEYYNNTIYFVDYLRADYMCCLQEDPTDLPLVKFSDIRHTENMRMRDFRRELNKVVPFRYRRNVRPVTLLRGMSRNVEWHWDK